MLKRCLSIPVIVNKTIHKVLKLVRFRRVEESRFDLVESKLQLRKVTQESEVEVWVSFRVRYGV